MKNDNQKKMRRLMRWGVVVCAGLLWVGCQGRHQNVGSETTSPVWVEDVAYRTIEEYTTATGTAKAVMTAEIKAEAAGAYELQRNPRTGKPYQLGDAVSAGDVVIKLVNREYVNNVQLESKKLNVEIAEKEWEGQKILLEKGGATRKDVNHAEATYINNKLALDNAHITLEKLNIKAPFDGTLVKLPYYTPGVEVTGGAEMMEMMDYSQMYLEVQFPENAISRLKVGQQVHVTNYNFKSDTLRGELTQLSPAIREDSRTFSGFIRIQNPGLLLRPGMFVKAEVVTVKKRDVLSIPKEIISYRRGGAVVFKVNNSIAEERNITTGISDDQYIEVLKGVSEGEQVVVKGYEWLRNGSRVKVMH